MMISEDYCDYCKHNATCGKGRCVFSGIETQAVFSQEEADVMLKALDLYAGASFGFLDDYEALDLKYFVDRICNKVIQYTIEEENEEDES